MTNEIDTNKPFSQFYAVVLYHRMGSGLRVRWSTHHGSWVRNAGYSRYLRDPWLSEPATLQGEPDAPSVDDEASAASIADRVVRPGNQPFSCRRCWRGDAQSHFIAPDIHGEPELYCVQLPAYSVVDSSGGTGRTKHWGSPFGCQATGHFIGSSELPNEPYIGPVAAYAYGTPLPAEEVINREWCSRCAGAAANVRENSTRAGEDPVAWARERVQTHVLYLSSKLDEYYGRR